MNPEDLAEIVAYLRKAPSKWLDESIHKLAEHMAEHTIFFSEDGKTALIMAQHESSDLFVKLTHEEYATGGGKIFWATSHREDF